MSHDKTHTFHPPLYHGNRAGPSEVDAGTRSAEQKGWDAYRKWLSRVSARPTRERSPFDHSIYSWKGYNTWADRVKQSWKPDDSDS